MANLIQIANYREEITREKARRQVLESYYEFFRHFWHTVSAEELVLNWHIKFICEELQKVGERVIEREPSEYDLLVNVPPGTSKSTMATILFPAWLWARDPSLKIISGSYSGTLSLIHSTASRDCIKSEAFQELFGEEVQVRKDIDAKSTYATEEGGVRFATSTGKSIIGVHAHLLLLDDPCELTTARSEKGLEAVNDWVLKRITTRKVDKENTPTIMIMQRLATDDPAGRWLTKKAAGKPIRHICLPATDEWPIFPADEVVEFDDEALTVAEWYEHQGGLLDDKRLSRAVLGEFETDLGTMDYAGQFGQQPRNLEGNIIKRSFFFWYEHQELPSKTTLHAYVDTALSEQELNKDNDFSAILLFALYKTRMYLVYAEKGRWSLPQLRRRVEWVNEKFLTSHSKVYVENTSAAKPLKYELREQNVNINIILDNIEHGKKERVQEILSILEAERIGFPIGDTWVDDYLEELLSFPRGHDDYVDTLTGAVIKTMKKARGLTLDPVRRR